MRYHPVYFHPYRPLGQQMSEIVNQQTSFIAIRSLVSVEGEELCLGHADGVGVVVRALVGGDLQLREVDGTEMVDV